MDEIVVIALVPRFSSILRICGGTPEHVGTLDLDVGSPWPSWTRPLRSLTAASRRRFTPDENEDGRPTRQRWRIWAREGYGGLSHSPSTDADQGGRSATLSQIFAANHCTGLTLAFQIGLHPLDAGQSFGDGQRGRLGLRCLEPRCPQGACVRSSSENKDGVRSLTT